MKRTKNKILKFENISKIPKEHREKLDRWIGKGDEFVYAVGLYGKRTVISIFRCLDRRASWELEKKRYDYTVIRSFNKGSMIKGNIAISVDLSRVKLQKVFGYLLEIGN